MTASRERPKPGKRHSRRTKSARNLTLSDEAVARGEAHARAAGVSLSSLVDRMLRALPPEYAPDPAELPPRLRRLRAMLATHGGPAPDWRAEYREHLYRKHVGKPEP